MDTLYVEKDTFIHNVHPINKLFYTLTLALTAMIISNIYFTIACIILNVAVLLSGKVFKNTFPILGFSAIVILTILLIQGMFGNTNETELFRLGFMTFYKEGIYYAISLSLKIINIILSFSVLVLTTKPSDLIESLVRKGLSPKIGYVSASVLQIIPEMMTTTDTISDAQRSRGLEVDGNIITRIKAFVPLIGPVVMNSLLSTRERAIAIEVRGFNSERNKTFLNEIKESQFDKVFQYICMILILLAIIWRVVM